MILMPSGAVLMFVGLWLPNSVGALTFWGMRSRTETFLMAIFPGLRTVMTIFKTASPPVVVWKTSALLLTSKCLLVKK